MIDRTMTAIVLQIAVFASLNNAWALDIAPLRYEVDKESKAYIPYAASHTLGRPNPAITRIVLSIHSSGYDAMQYYENAYVAAEKVRGALPQTLIIAPQFFQRKVIPGPVPPGLVYWTVSPYWGSWRAAVGPESKPLRRSTYEVIDELLEQLVSSGHYPRLKQIVLVGHSAGGQLVQRYAMVGKYEPTRVQMRYVISAPSSYAYPSGERFHAGKGTFTVPDKDTIEACQGYNQWGYGLDKPYSYFSGQDSQQIESSYADKRVFYLCGAKDIDPNDESLGKSCGSMLQGVHRLQRMMVFKSYLEFKYGKQILRNHRFAVVQNVGHYGKGTMTSPAGLQAIFAPIR